MQWITTTTITITTTTTTTTTTITTITTTSLLLLLLPSLHAVATANATDYYWKIRNCFSISGSSKRYFSSPKCQNGSGAHPVCYSMITRGPGHEAVLSIPSSAGVKKSRDILYSTYVVSTCTETTFTIYLYKMVTLQPNTQPSKLLNKWGWQYMQKNKIWWKKCKQAPRNF
jgi:hypothetical protein